MSDMRIKSRILSLLAMLLFLQPLLSAVSPETENLFRVRQTLTRLSVPFEQRSLLEGFGGFGSSLLVHIRGNTLGTLVIAVPLDADFAVDIGLALIQRMRNETSSVRMIVAFLGNERSSFPESFGGVTHKGLKDMLSLVDIPENWLLAYLDIAEAPEALVLQHGTRNYVTPLEVVRPLTSLLNSTSIAWSFQIRYNEIYKLALVDSHEALPLAWQNEVNSFVILSTAKSNAKGTEITPEIMADVLFDFSSSVPFPLIKADRHYFFFKGAENRLLFFSEAFIVTLFIVIAALCLLLFIIFSVKRYVLLFFYTRLFLRTLWVFLILLPLMVVSLKTAMFLYSRIVNTFAPHILQAAQPNYAGVALTILLSVFIFFLPSPLLALIRFPRRAEFHGVSSLIFITIGLFFAVFFNFSLVPVFLWAFFFVFLAALIPNPFVIFSCVLCVPVFAVSALLNIFQTGSSVITLFFMRPIWSDIESWVFALTVSFLLLPSILLIKRGVILVQKSINKGIELKPKRTYRLVVLPAFIAVIMGAMLTHILHIPKDEDTAVRTFIDEGDDTENGILQLGLFSINFQELRILTIHIQADDNPVRFDLSLERVNGGNFQVHFAPVPFDRTDGGNQIRFLLGENPPNPLTLEIVLSQHFEGILKASALYRDEQRGARDDILQVSRSVLLTPET